MPKYDVLRQHEGDKFYKAGDTREVASADVVHLVRSGVLALAAGEKADPAHEDKSEPKPANKADQSSAHKRDPLDHDGDGKKGGSLPKSERETKG